MDQKALPEAGLAEQLAALASAPRLAILHVLRTPRELHDIRVTAEGSDRPLSRQTVTHHLEQLEALGLVVRVPGGRGDQYLLHHARLFGVVDGLRQLAKIHPSMLDVVVDGTMPGPDAGDPPLPAPPRLAVAYGREDGVGFGLDGPVGSKWRIGRAATCAVRLDHDPFVSSTNSVVERTAGGYTLADVQGSRNGTWLNWERLGAGQVVGLESGDVVTAGRTHLVFKA